MIVQRIPGHVLAEQVVGREREDGTRDVDWDAVRNVSLTRSGKRRAPHGRQLQRLGPYHEAGPVAVCALSPSALVRQISCLSPPPLMMELTALLAASIEWS